MNGFFDDMSRRQFLSGWAIIILPLVALAVLITVFVEKDPIDSRDVVGCYTASDAPPLHIQPDKIRIMDGSNRSFAYRLDWKQNVEYHLAVSPALQLTPTADGNLRFIRQRGIGYFWSMLPETSNDPRRLRSPEDFGDRFVMFASNGDKVIYAKTRGMTPCG